MNLSEIRKSAGLTIQALASALNLSVRTIIRWEQGKSRIPADAIPKLAKAYGVSEKKILDAIRIPLGDIEALKQKKGA